MGEQMEGLADALRFVGTRSARVLDRLRDEEFFWEPVDDAWTIRPRRADEPVGSPTCVGVGDYVLDDADHDPDPAPFTTIAWRLGHLILINGMFSDHFLGSANLRFDEIAMPRSADEAIDALRSSYLVFADRLATLDDDHLSRSLAAAWGARKEQTLRDWTLVLLQENVHHLAEVGVVRDLFRHRSARSESRE